MLTGCTLCLLLLVLQAWDWGCSGPLLRASGIDWDLRKAQPYDAYGKMDFAVPVAGHGDCFDRYLVRLGTSLNSGLGGGTYSKHILCLMVDSFRLLYAAEELCSC